MTQTTLADRRSRVFISFDYEHDASAAALIARSLQRDFVVELTGTQFHPGQNVRSAILEAIESSDILVILLSRAALDTRWVEAETAMELSLESKRRDIDLVPVLLEPCEVPEGLRDRLTVDLSEDGALGVGRLIARLKGDRAIDFKALNGQLFERLVRDVLEYEGFAVTPAGDGRDMGYDFAGRRGSESWLVQVKHYSQKRVSVAAIHEIAKRLRGMDSDANALLVTSGQLTSVAQEYLRDTSDQSGAHISVIDSVELKQLIAKHPDLIDKYFASGQPRRG